MNDLNSGWGLRKIGQDGVLLPMLLSTSPHNSSGWLLNANSFLQLLTSQVFP
jgi:hypothetical protein